jgi:hypothetical protein
MRAFFLAQGNAETVFPTACFHPAMSESYVPRPRPKPPSDQGHDADVHPGDSRLSAFPQWTWSGACCSMSTSYCRSASASLSRSSHRYSTAGKAAVADPGRRRP